MLQKFNEHASFDYHNLSVTKAEGFLSIYSNKTPSIITALDNDRLDSWNNFSITIILLKSIIIIYKYCLE